MVPVGIWECLICKRFNETMYMFRLKNERQNTRCQYSNCYKNNALFLNTKHLLYRRMHIVTIVAKTNTHFVLCWLNGIDLCLCERREKRRKKKTQQKTKICVGVLKLCLVHQSNAPAIEVAVRGPFNVRRHQSRWLIFGIKSIKNQFQRIKPLKRRVNGFATNRIFVGSNET